MILFKFIIFYFYTFIVNFIDIVFFNDLIDSLYSFLTSFIGILKNLFISIIIFILSFFIYLYVLFFYFPILFIFHRKFFKRIYLLEVDNYKYFKYYHRRLIKKSFSRRAIGLLADVFCNMKNKS